MLWKMHLANILPHAIDVNIDEALDFLEETKMNGREISNSIGTARTLAESEGSKLKLEYLQTIVQIWSEFETLQQV